MKKMFFVCALSFITFVTKAQQVWSADIKVQSIAAHSTVSGYVCVVTVHSHWDDNARHAYIQIQLPLNVRVLSMPDGTCTTTQIPPNVAGSGNSYVRCSLGDISVNGTKTISIKTTKSDLGNTPSYKTFSAMTWSNSPDPDLSNNYRSVVVQ